MNGFTLGGRQLKVGWANSALAASPATAFGLPGVSAQSAPATATAAAAAAAAAAATAAAAAAGGNQGVTSLMAEGEGGKVSSSTQRAQIMANLVNRPSKILLLKNMVDPDDVDEQLEEEITEECIKFGPVTKVIIATLEEGAARHVKIFVQFQDEAATKKAVASLHHRWFGGKMVHAQTYDETRFARQDFTA